MRAPKPGRAPHQAKNSLSRGLAASSTRLVKGTAMAVHVRAFGHRKHTGSTRAERSRKPEKTNQRFLISSPCCDCQISNWPQDPESRGNDYPYSPKAEVVSSNLAGSAILLNEIARSSRASIADTPPNPHKLCPKNHTVRPNRLPIRTARFADHRPTAQPWERR